MTENMDKFAEKNHIVSIALHDDVLYGFSAFYAYDRNNSSLIFASDINTLHMKICNKNNEFFALISTNNEKIISIKGLQIYGKIQNANKEQQNIYFKRFPYAITLHPKLFCAKIYWAKFTDNKLLLNKKEVWKEEGNGCIKLVSYIENNS